MQVVPIHCMNPICLPLLVLAFSLSATGASGGTEQPNNPPVQHNDDRPEQQGTGEAKTSALKGAVEAFTDVPYDIHNATSLNFWMAQGEGPRPVVVFIHGGGWIKGGKSSGGTAVREMLDAGISVASIGYRLATEAPLPAPVHDAARSIQFLRTKASEWNIDKDRIAVAGGSAGACTAMWLLFHDDLADPASPDPVARESSRVAAAAAGSGQTSIDPKFIEPLLGRYGISHPMIHKSVGASSLSEALDNYDRYASLYREFSPINHVTKGDPPLFMHYARSMTLPPENQNHGIHHPLFGVKMKEACDRVGVECHLVVNDAPDNARYSNQSEFLLDKLLSPVVDDDLRK